MDQYSEFQNILFRLKEGQEEKERGKMNTRLKKNVIYTHTERDAYVRIHTFIENDSIQNFRTSVRALR